MAVSGYAKCNAACIVSGKFCGACGIYLNNVAMQFCTNLGKEECICVRQSTNPTVTLRSSHRTVLLKILQNSQNNICARVSFLIKLQVSGLRPASLSKKRLWHRCFRTNFARILITPFYLQNTSRQLFLNPAWQNSKRERKGKGVLFWQ